ncbi:PREDICTED: cytoplasmic polyadenylation element-binding protein 2 [Elephantulus edwardii]|uniref:cytoplasmic polyadenylation element-binding protein 2 n=1 Tax=Elephantulus edwardii TaxID=28737 RepID=UPI0003F0B7D0|nr:PREDICTED: cytoplasmic polyadenylation element-binding protein 2 [Elephantulus edwardii]
MRDLGFGVLQTSPLRKGSPGPSLGAGTSRPSAAPPPRATPFGPPLPVTGFPEAASLFSIALGGGRAGGPLASSSSPHPAPPPPLAPTMQDELLLGLTPQPAARPLPGAAAAEKLANPRAGGGGGGANAGVTHLLPSPDFKPSLHLPASSSASSCCCGRTSSPQDFSPQQQQGKGGGLSPAAGGGGGCRLRRDPSPGLPGRASASSPSVAQRNSAAPQTPAAPQPRSPAAFAACSRPLLKQSPWSNHQSSGWGTGSMSWGTMHGRDHRRTGNMGLPGTMNQISPLKKPFSGNVIAPPKFSRSTPSLTPKSWIEDNVFRTDNNSNTLLPLQVRSSLQLPAWGSDSLQDSWCTAAGTSRIDQDRSRMYDSLNMHSLENSLIDIMRAEHDPLKGRLSYPHPGTDNLLMLNARSYGRRRGRSSLFPIDDGLLDDGHSDQVGVLNSPACYSAHQNGERIERFSRKVFVGGLPPDIDEDEITASFRRFGPLVVDWPHKAESKSYFPPKGYAFLLFQEESSVQALIDACIEEDGKLYLCVSSPTIKDKPVQIRPWNLSDSDFVMDGSQPLDPRKTIFVGGVPRPLRAVELAMIMDRLYGGVCYAGIDTDPELKYPKGAGRVAFSNQQSYIAAISARFVQLQHGDIDKRVEVKPYVLDDQMCDECQGARCGGKFAPFFCANVTCLQYYCEFCWANIHSRAGREFHKPLVKEGADRPRQIHFRWN